MHNMLQIFLRLTLKVLDEAYYGKMQILMDFNETQFKINFTYSQK